MNDETKIVSFETTISSFGNNTGIIIPNELIEKLAAGKRPSLLVKVNDYQYQCAPGVMNGKSVVSFSSEHRENTGLKGGDKVRVELAVATSQRKVEMPEDFSSALKKTKTEDFFNTLSNSLQRYHCDLIKSSKTEETRQNRIDKAITLFKQGKKR